MNQVERRRMIRAELQRSGTVVVRDLAETLDVTMVTIRGDLEYLERRGLALRSHGGAVLPETDRHMRLIDDTIHENYEKKNAIARKAVELVKAGSTIILDAGSTVTILARQLTDMDITVVTNSVPVIGELVSDDRVNLIAMGGAVRKQVNAMVGELTRIACSTIRVDLLFMGASGFSPANGVTTVNLFEAETKKAMIKSAGYVCLLVDSTKLGSDKFARVCDWNAVDEIITNPIPGAVAQELEERGVKVTVAEVGG